MQCCSSAIARLAVGSRDGREGSLVWQEALRLRPWLLPHWARAQLPGQLPQRFPLLIWLHPSPVSTYSMTTVSTKTALSAQLSAPVMTSVHA